MTARAEHVEAILTALSEVDGIRPAAPALRPVASWNPAALAVDLTPELVRVRLVATALPLPPRLRLAGDAVAKALVGSAYADAVIRLVVTDVDGSAFGA
ncbi:hypothetical protein [Amycolatopsis methanolica]|uniref:Uncharacterized protein n=1 Tax=Amycolatopsis methanolica 239 TaxID=1068978 RepID=A0A076MWX0_AMYME|nr:hypothetical protein [Amycolatopsis methanolica]AIJ23536.1 hypothetical protein AMETH_3444 [Amycolatopsis methanolica 239]